MTHIVQVNHESDVASNSGTELSLTDGQPEASGWAGMARLPLGRVHVLPSFFTVIGQNLPIPLKHIVKQVLSHDVLLHIKRIQHDIYDLYSFSSFTTLN